MSQNLQISQVKTNIRSNIYVVLTKYLSSDKVDISRGSGQASDSSSDSSSSSSSSDSESEDSGQESLSAKKRKH